MEIPFVFKQAVNSASRVPEDFVDCGETVMTNFDGSIDEEVAANIKDKPYYADYTAWNFYGQVWYQDEKWCCAIMTYGSYQETLVADTLQEIMDSACEQYGKQ